MCENPELAERVEKHGDRFAGSGCDLVVEAVELDDVMEVNLAGAPYVQPDCGASGIENSAVEVAQNASYELGRQAVDELFLFIQQPLTIGDPSAIPRSWGHCLVHVPLHVSDQFRGKSTRGLFGDVMMEVDWSVGKILGAIKNNGLDDNTLVIFSSDNGPWLNFGDHAGSAAPLREGKGTSWDGGVREPTLMRWPGHLPAGRSCNAPLMTIDILPTIANLIGAKLPEKPIDGLDIPPVILGKTDNSPHEALYFYYNANDLEALRSGKWKLELPRQYRTLNGRPGGTGGKPTNYEPKKITAPELYDLDADPGQLHNMADANPAVLRKLLEHAEKARAELGDNLTTGRAEGEAVFPNQFPKLTDAAQPPNP